jgi:hypothetical protein
MGYGMIISINIYALVCTLVIDPEFSFFGEGSSGFLELLMKLLVIAGGALTMQKSMALVGNLVSQGAGSNELRDNAFSMGGLARMAKGVAGKALGAASLPLKPFGSIIGNAYGMQTRHLGMRMLRGMGLDGGYPRKTDKDGKSGNGSDSGSTNNEKTNYGSNPNSTKDAINNNKDFKRSFGGGGNANNNKSNQNKNNTVNNVINNLSNMTGKKK